MIRAPQLTANEKSLCASKLGLLYNKRYAIDNGLIQDYQSACCDYLHYFISLEFRIRDFELRIRMSLLLPSVFV
jgi:hypothetical protein